MDCYQGSVLTWFEATFRFYLSKVIYTFKFLKIFFICSFSHTLQSQVIFDSEFITYPYNSELWTFVYFLERKAGIEENNLLKKLSGLEIYSQIESV